MPAALTLRQAKAAHKARGGPAVSERELRQLQREIQLDQRAWAIKEREKSRGAVAQKRLEEQQRAKAEEEAIRLGTQRRCDRFGHKSSQYHLGAFFTRASKLGQPVCDEPQVSMVDPTSLATYEFEDDEDEIDDETLLAALHEVDDHVSPKCNRIHSGTDSGPMSRLCEDMAWDEFLDSATQIHRELAAEPPQASNSKDSIERSSLDSSYSLGLTSQDIEALDPTCTTVLKTKTATTSDDDDMDRKMMPASAILPQRCTDTHKLDGQLESSPTRISAEFSLTQLEHFVDEDMTLSQI